MNPYEEWLRSNGHGPPPAICPSLPRGSTAVEAANSLARQEGGQHYKGMAIQPVQYIMANGIGFVEGNVIKYVSRWRDKGGVEDLKKARHFLDILIEAESKP